jgi:hypothetical protein
MEGGRAHRGKGTMLKLGLQPLASHHPLTFKMQSIPKDSDGKFYLRLPCALHLIGNFKPEGPLAFPDYVNHYKWNLLHKLQLLSAIKQYNFNYS